MPLRLHTEACASKMCKLQEIFGLFVFAKLLGIIFVIRHLIVVFFPHSTVSSSSSSSNNKWTGTARKTRRRRRKRRRQSGMKRKMTLKTRKMEWSELPLIKKKKKKKSKLSKQAFSTGSFKFESTLTAQRKDGVEWVNPYSWSNFSYLIFFSKSQFFELFHVRMQEMELG